MAVESKPLFHPEVIRQHLRMFTMPESVAAFLPKLQEWAAPISSGRADKQKESELLCEFFIDNWGAAGRSLQIEYDFCEFARLEFWDGKRKTGQLRHRISEQKVRHHHLHVEFDTATSKWKDTGSSPAQIEII